jgi:LPS-assembly protein
MEGIKFCVVQCKEREQMMKASLCDTYNAILNVFSTVPTLLALHYSTHRFFKPVSLALVGGFLCLGAFPVNAQQVQQMTQTITLSDSLSGNPEEKLELRGKVEISKGTVKVFAPEVDFDVANDIATARGGVVAQLNKDVFRAPEFKINLNTGEGYAPFPEFFYAKHNGRGTAKNLLMSESQLQVLNDVNYTSCKPGQNDWVMKADTLTLDNASQTGIAKGAVIRFFDVPIFALPHFEFPLGNDRRSGVLTPSAGYNSLSGVDLSVPYYFNLAHNYDLTATTRYMTRRGLQLTADARYLTQYSSTDARLDWLPNDLVKQDRRWGAFLHNSYSSSNWSGGVNIERVSDNAFFADLTKSSNAASQTSLPGELWARYQASWGEISARSSRYQTLQDATNSIVPAYDRLPVVNLSLTPLNWKGFKFELQAQSTRFSSTTAVQGTRNYVVPQVSYDYHSDWGFFTPKVALNTAQYSHLNGPAYQGLTTFNRSLPIASLDTGLVFERSAHWFGKSALQTLEPRLYFLYVPFKDQAKVPLFDTSLTGFSFAQIFSDNVFTGQDRIADAKHITPALSSRWVDPASGSELFKMTVGKRYYFNPQRVQLTGAALPDNGSSTSSDWLFAAAGQINQQISIDTAFQYDQTNKEVVNSAYTLRYNPSQRQLISLSKRFTKDTQNAVDLSWQWKLSPNSAMMGRAAYSLGVPSANLTKGLTETLIGYEYDAGCWVFRIAANRYSTTANTKATSLYFQLDLSGLTQVGSGSLDTVKRNIPGYLPFESKPTWTYDAFRPF